MKPGLNLERVLYYLPEMAESAAALVTHIGPDVLKNEAAEFRLLPLLAHYLPEQFNISQEERLSTRYISAKMEKVVAELIDLFDAEQLPLIVLKGSAAGRFYPEAWLRPTGDIDILINPIDLPRAALLLQRSGWTALPFISGPLTFAHHRVFKGPSGIHLEVHFALSWHFQAGFKIGRIFQRAIRVPFRNKSMLVLSRGDSLVYNCIHFAGHVFVQPKSLFDIKLETFNDFPWNEVPSIAKEAGVSTPTAIALVEARERIGAKIPSEVISSLGAKPSRIVLARACQAIPDKYYRTRWYFVDLLLADTFSKKWIARMGAPFLKRAARIARAIRGKQ